MCVIPSRQKRQRERSRGRRNFFLRFAIGGYSPVQNGTSSKEPSSAGGGGPDSGETGSGGAPRGLMN